ncbi:hypothetical protein D3C81_582570 [compost metagenome]
MPAFRHLDLRQQFDAQVRGKHHGHHPGSDQRNANDPEHVRGVLTSGRLGKTVGHKADRRHQRPRQHRRGRVAPGISGGLDSVVALLHLHHHHFNGNDCIVHQQSQRQNQRAQGNSIEVFARGRHDNEHGRQGQRHRRGNHNADTPAHAEKTHQQHHAQGSKKLHHELVDGGANIHRLIRDLGQAHAQRHLLVDRCGLSVQRLPQIQAVPAVAHDHAEQQCRLAVVAYQERRGVLITAFDLSHIGQLEGSALHRQWGITNLLQVIKRAIQADENLWALRFNRAGRRYHVLRVQRTEDVSCGNAQRRQTLVGQLDKNALGLFTDDVDLLHTRHMQQTLAQALGFAHQQSLRLTLGLERIEREGDIGILIIDHRADHPRRQPLLLIQDFLARLVKLLLDG